MKKTIFSTCIAITIALSLLQCSNVGNGNHHNYNNEFMVCIDLSGSSDSTKFPDPETLYSYILLTSNLASDNHYSGGLTVYISSIGDEYRPYIKALVLEPYDAFGNRKNRRNEIKRFKQLLFYTIEEVYKLPVNRSKTLLYSGLSYQFEVMKDNQFAQSHSMIIVSDCLEYGHYDFSKDNALDDHDALSESLEDMYPFGSLDGFDITIISVENRRAYDAQEFLKKHLNSHGANAKIRSNILIL